MLIFGGFVNRCFRGMGGGCFETWVLFKNLASVADVLSGIEAREGRVNASKFKEKNARRMWETKRWSCSTEMYNVNRLAFKKSCSSTSIFIVQRFFVPCLLLFIMQRDLLARRCDVIFPDLAEAILWRMLFNIQNSGFWHWKWLPI